MAVALLNANRTPPAARIPPTEYTADDRSSRKVKFLYSFGGKITPRQSDGALSYVGGLTRIIAVRRDSTFNELFSKMEDAYGGPVLICYQLPDQDLDSLVCVSCVDRSAKLPVFLCSRFDTESNADSGPGYGDPRRAHPLTFKQNSDDGGDGFNNEGTSTTILLASLNASRFVENDNSSELEYKRFPAHLTIDCPTNTVTQTLNLPSVGNHISSTSKAPHQGTERYGLDPLEKFQMLQKSLGADRMNFIPMETLEEEEAQSFGPSQPVQMGLFGDTQIIFAAALVKTSQLDCVASLQHQQQQWSQKKNSGEI